MLLGVVAVLFGPGGVKGPGILFRGKAEGLHIGAGQLGLGISLPIRDIGQVLTGKPDEQDLASFHDLFKIEIQYTKNLFQRVIKFHSLNILHRLALEGCSRKKPPRTDQGRLICGEEGAV